MLKEKDLSGIFVPTVTPFKSNEELDWDSYNRYLKSLLHHDIRGLVINGTTGEAPTLSWKEVEDLVRVTKQYFNKCSKRIPIIVGTGTNSTATTVKRTEIAGEIGADAVLVVTPYYNRPSQEGVLEHFRKVVRVGVPVVAYEVPSRTCIHLSTDTVNSILDMNGVIGLKDSTRNINLISKLDKTKPILCGDDINFYSMLEQGASGGILASANIHTDLFLEVYRLFNQNELVSSKRVFDSLGPLIKSLFQESNPSPLKWVLAKQGILATDTLRLPMGPISIELRKQLNEILENFTQ
ncbi:4-hydroxy-tetrahydrodipicolinate synthase [Metabacillus halosaccharovorans]|uniref:4-hydroxy-tetrahydrodipicolinate synthase n=1 Tax=Metabacillus halosaccharovorans TaxID=930124 RepID=UPI000995956B|nr:4-hydroxy-tetrahydrodipicolinate synthase [Metabacillus halosaccharovorans]